MIDLVIIFHFVCYNKEQGVVFKDWKKITTDEIYRSADESLVFDDSAVPEHCKFLYTDIKRSY